jgi:eukaryotic-like serine/threonine-protein kinase
MVAQMTPQTSCPDPAAWGALLEGSLTREETGELSVHLEHCETCRQRLETLSGSDDESSGVLRKMGAARPATEPGLQDVIAKLKEEGSKVESEAPCSEGEEILLGFLSPPENPGQLGRLGHYDVLEVIGRGGMGIVLKAFDQNLQRVVAIKVMSPHLAASASARRRFVREARAAAAIRNEHVIDIHSVEEANGLPYFVMGFIAGVSLQERLDRSGPLELKEILRIGMQTARGLAAAHAEGLIHRDVKPANILLENGVERVKLTDFGLARAVDDASLTQSGVLAGTPQYMSPEQARGEPLDSRSDLFSLGSVLYALCTGRPPFRAGSTMGVLKRICDDTLRDVRATDPAIPAWLVAIIGRLHAKDPAARFQSADEVADLLARHLANLQQPGTTALVPATAAEDARRLPSRRRFWAVAFVLLALGATGTLLGVYRYATNQGELIIETEDPDVEITVKENGEQVMILDKKSGRTVTLRAGRYRLELGDGAHGLALSTDHFTLERGDKKIVTVTLGPPAIREVRRFEGAPDAVYVAVICPGDRYVLSGGGTKLKDGQWETGSDFDLRLWDRATGKELARLPSHEGPVLCVGISPDGKRAVSGGCGISKDKTDNAVRVWDLENRKELKRFTKHTGRVMSAAFLPNGRQVVSVGGNADGGGAYVRLWDVETCKEIRQFDGHAHEVRWVAVLPDGKRFVTTGQDGRAFLWDVDSSKPIRSLGKGAGGALTPDGRLVALTISGPISLVDVETGLEIQSFAGHTKWTGGLAFSPDGKRLLSGGYDNLLRLWDVETGKQVCEFKGNFQGPTDAVGFTADGKEALAKSWNSSLRLLRLPPVAPANKK